MNEVWSLLRGLLAVETDQHRLEVMRADGAYLRARTFLLLRLRRRTRFFRHFALIFA
jgi:hypothetical protein